MEDAIAVLYEKTIPAENHDIIPIELVCDLFKLDARIENRKIENDAFYNISKLANETLFNDKKKRTHLDKRGFIRWVLQLNCSLIEESLKAEFLDYQINIIDYLYDNANQQEAILKKAGSLKKRKQELYLILSSGNAEFVEYINIGAEIARLGKDNKEIQQKIAGIQISLDL